MNGLKPETIAVIETGRRLFDVYNTLTDLAKKTKVAWLMHEHLVVAAHLEGLTVDEIEELLNRIND